MILDKTTLKRRSSFTKKCTLKFNGDNGSIYVSKVAANLLSPPCQLAFDLDRMICFHSENGLLLRYYKSGFFIHSYMLVKKIEEILNVENPMFEVRSTIDPHIFHLTLVIK